MTLIIIKYVNYVLKSPKLFMKSNEESPYETLAFNQKSTILNIINSKSSRFIFKNEIMIQNTLKILYSFEDEISINNFT